MITRQDHPTDRRMMIHLGKRLAPHLRRGGLGVEGVAREEDSRHTLHPRMLGKPANRRVPRLAQLRRQVAGELPKALPEMQIARMYESECHQEALSCPVM